MFDESNRLGDVVARFPLAGELLTSYKIDYCCGGERSLAMAATEAQIDVRQLVVELNDAFTKAERENAADVNWMEAPFVKLINHVITTHHAYLTQTLPVLSELTTKILRVHGELHGDMLGKLHRQFHIFKMDMEQHTIQEETMVFPLITEYEQHSDADLLATAMQRIETLEQEHQAAGDLLKDMRRITNDYRLPEGACKTFKRTYDTLQELESDTFKHVHLENNILFVRLRDLLSATK